MLEAIGVNLQTYHNIRLSAKKTLDEALKLINESYAGKLKDEKTDEARRIFNETVEKSQNECLAACQAVLDEVKEGAEKVDSDAIKPGYTDTLEAIKRIPKMTVDEAERIRKSFADNYLAFRGFDFLKLKPVSVSVTDILEAADELGKEIRRCFSVNVDGYRFQNMMNGDTLPYYDKLFTAFVNKKFDVAAAARINEQSGDEAGNVIESFTIDSI